MGLTLVSALFDLPRREGNPNRPPISDYLERGEFLFTLDADLVLFADPALAPEIAARRHRAGHADRTRVVELPFEDLAAVKLADRIAHARGRHPVHNANPDKDTPLYIALGWGKFELLERAGALDPFGASHLAWIDLGLLGRPHPDDRVFETPSDLVRLLVLRPFDGSDFVDRAEYFAYIRGHLSAGYISGGRDCMLRACDVFADVAREALDAGFGPSEEQLLPLVYERRPDLFGFHHGDYGCALSNYERLRGGGENLLMQLRTAREAELHSWGLAIAEALVASDRDGTFEAEPELLAQLLDECYLAAWYDGNRALAGEVAATYTARVAADRRFREVFLRDEIRLRSNFGLLREPPAEQTLDR